MEAVVEFPSLSLVFFQTFKDCKVYIIYTHDWQRGNLYCYSDRSTCVCVEVRFFVWIHSKLLVGFEFATSYGGAEGDICSKESSGSLLDGGWVQMPRLVLLSDDGTPRTAVKTGGGDVLDAGEISRTAM